MGRDRCGYGLFYRVEDEGSQAVTIPGEGITAVGTARINFWAKNWEGIAELQQNVKDHLDWYSDCKSPFISVYADEQVAINIAKGRKKLGKQNVTITVIDTSKVRGGMNFRKMRPLAKRLGIRIPYKAYNNSEHEWIFLHHIPDDAIVYYG